MAIKKAFVGLHAFLVANENKKVSTILDEFTEMCSAKGAGGASTTVHRNEAGEPVAILDYYFKKWLPLEFVEFGAKANSSTGFNTMCKLGTSLWTKQQRDFKKGKEELLERVAAGEIEPAQIQEHLDRLETERSYIAPYPVPQVAFDSVEEFEAADHEAMAQAVAEYEASLVEPEADDEAA